MGLFIFALMKEELLAGKRWFPWVLFLVGYLLYSANSGGLMLYALDEAKNSGCAREMLLSEEYVVPMFNGMLRTDKPPLHYYHMMLSYRIFGVNEFAARFFSGVYGALTVLLVFLFARRHLGLRAAFWAAVTLLASVHTAFQFHFAVPDPYLIFFLTLGCFCFFEAYQNPRPRYLIGLYVGVALGTLAKGPVAIGLPGLIFLVFLISQRQLKWSRLRLLRPFLGALAVALIVLPWYLLVWQATDGEWVREFFFTHNLNRYTDTMEMHRGYGVLPILFPLVGLMPLGVFIPQAVRRAWRERSPITTFALVGMAVIIGFFIFSQTFLPNYTVPAYPYLALLVGWFLAKVSSGEAPRIGPALWAFMIISVLVPVGGYIALKNDPTLSPIAPHAAWLAALPLGALLALIWGRKGQRSKALMALGASGMVSIVLIYFGFYPQMDALNPVARTLPDMDPARPLVYYKIMNPAYIFYLDEPVPGTHTLAELQAFLDEHPDAYVISRTRWRGDLKKVEGLSEYRVAKDIMELPTTLILTYENHE